jgi:hypothetical protein
MLTILQLKNVFGKSVTRREGNLELKINELPSAPIEYTHNLYK